MIKMQATKQKPFPVQKIGLDMTLKPCPCCGGEAVFRTILRHEIRVPVIECGSCAAQVGPFLDEIQVVRGWNARPKPKKQPPKGGSKWNTKKPTAK